MAKYGTGKNYGAGWLYGPDPQYLLGVGNIPGAAALGLPAVSPGPVAVSGVGNISTTGTFGTPRIFRIPQRLALALDIRRLRVSPTTRHLATAPQINSLQVTPDA